MSKRNSLLLFFVIVSITSFAQHQPIYEVTAGVGNGIRFWQDDRWKIHMGNTAEYLYGPVTDYSIKVNMDPGTGRGWTWGSSLQTPIAALNNLGHLKIASHFESNGNVVSYRASRGYLGLTAGLPGYADGEYPTLKTDYKYLYFSADGKYSAFLGDTEPLFGVNGANGFPKVVLHSNGHSYLNGGNVGLGTATPDSKLVVLGSGNSAVDLKVNGRIQTGDSNNLGGVWLNNPGSMFVGQRTSTSLGLYNNGAWRLVIDNGGKIGIGTSSPDQQLTVKGKIHAEEVIIDLSVPAPDYVFEQKLSSDTT